MHPRTIQNLVAQAYQLRANNNKDSNDSNNDIDSSSSSQLKLPPSSSSSPQQQQQQQQQQHLVPTTATRSKKRLNDLIFDLFMDELDDMKEFRVNEATVDRVVKVLSTVCDFEPQHVEALRSVFEMEVRENAEEDDDEMQKQMLTAT